MSVNYVEQKDKHYTRRVSQVGNSLSVNIPKELTKKLNIQKGDEVEVNFDEKSGEIILNKVNRSISNGIRPEVLKAMERAVTKYDQALRNLKDR